MGAFTKSILILLIAISTPLLYRQFAPDNTIKYMSSYYSNYKVIDNFLRQSADHLDTAKGYIPDVDISKAKDVLGELNQKFKTFIASKSSDSSQSTGGSSVSHEKAGQPEPRRLSQCPGEEAQVPLWSKEELAKYDGNSEETSQIYLGFLGLVYNVSLGWQHYGPGNEYNAFAGKDATRAFVTGNFTHDLHDDIRAIDESMYSHIESWASFYGSNYPVLGRIEGQFFDSRGCGTKELGRIYQIFDKLSNERTSQQNQDQSLPECNSEWNSDLKKGRVWCSTKSGGIERDWVGSPRLYNDGKSKRCVCLNRESQDASQHVDQIEEYPNCNPTANECHLSSA